MASQFPPLELELLKKKLDADFFGHIIGCGSDEDAKKSNFYSKAIAAFTLHKMAGATIDDAVKASIDGGDDHGIDSVYVGNDYTLWLVQSKYINSGWGEPELGDVSKFRDGVNDLLQCKFDRFNQALKTKISEIERVLNMEFGRVQVILVHTGHALSDSRRHIFGELERNFNSTTPDFLRWSSNGLSKLHDYQLEDFDSSEIEEEIELQDFGQIQSPYKAFYGRLSAKYIAEIYGKYGSALVEKNIRRFKGSTDVNEGLTNTIKQEPEHLFYFNNGITFLCGSISVVGSRDPNKQVGRFKVKDISIINGAQTAGAIAQQKTEYYEENPAEVLATFVCIENAPDEFAQCVTKYRNRQNVVNFEDFASLDERQGLWQKTLKAANITYIFKHGVDTPKISGNTFSIREVAPALACCITGSDWFEFMVTAKSNPQLFYQDLSTIQNQSKKTGMSEISKNSYNRIFADSLTAKEMWRTVQISRIVKNTVKARTKSESSPNKNILQEGRLLVLHIVLFKTQLRDGSSLNLDNTEIGHLSKAIDIVANEIVTQTLALNFQKQPKSIFRNKIDCQSIKQKMMQALGQQKL